MSVRSVGQPSLFAPERGVLHLRRRIVEQMALLFSGIFALLAVGFLIYFVFYVVRQGIQFITPNFFTKEPTFGGVANGGISTAIEGSLIMLAIASIIGIPLGMAVGVYLSEFGRGRVAQVVRFMVDMLTGIPTIIFGLLLWTILVAPSHAYSGLAGALALSIIMVPTVARATEEVLRLVPASLREASAALGGTESRTILQVVIPAARGGIVTGLLLALARVAGETAPLLMTALGTNFFISPDRLDVAHQPLDALPLRIFNYTLNPFPAQQQLAYSGATVLLFLVISTSLLVRLATGGFRSRR
ncbi:MAG TPA: phosphate ABC transporter permease PstA [Ktedonobacterales bacterium]|nr:phosphate ABC transporter permease PstA [Ktedonobacterales bacterium]